MQQFYYKFPAVRGTQANDSFYTCMIPIGLLPKLFSEYENDLPPQYRAQRKLNESRIPEIKKYILDNRSSYVFSAIAASVDGELNFISDNSQNIGVLEIPIDSTFLINDGQHRKAALLAAIIEDESLKNETIPVVIFKDKGLSRSQQMFTDLNKHAVNTSKSLNALYDSRDIYSIISKQVLEKVDFLNKYTDKEKDILGKFSQMLFTLNNFVNSNKKTIRVCKSANLSDDEITAFLIDYWNSVCKNITEWNELSAKEISKRELREKFIITQGVAILALGQLGAYYFENDIDYKKYNLKLKNIDWSRTNEKDWMGCSIKNNGRINRTENGINLTYLRIKQLIGLKITESEQLQLERSK